MNNFDEKTAKLVSQPNPTEFDPSTAKPYVPPKTTGLGLAKDIGLSLAKGAASVPGAILAVPDAALTGGKGGKFLEDKGLNFGDQAQAYFDKQHTDALKTKREEFEQAGSDEDTRMGKILDKAGYAISNPSLLVNTAAESIPSMIAGAKIGRAVGGKSMSGEAAGALGEGYMMAGQAAEEIRSNTEDRLLTPEQTGLAALTGVAGWLFSLAGNSLAKSAGLADVDSLLANGVKPTDIAKNLSTMPPKSIPSSMIKGAISEGLLEELPQIITETALQNIALGKDWDDGIEGDVVLGTLTGNMIGGLTSGAGAAMSRNQSNGVPEPQEQGETDNSPENEPLNTGGGAITQPVQDYALSPEFATERPYQPTRAEQAGLNPDDGSLSEAASVAVNGGAALLNSPVLEGEAIPYDGGLGYEQKNPDGNTYGVDAYGNVNYANGTDIEVPANQSKQIEFNDNWRGRAPVYEVDSDGNAMPTSGEAAASRKERFDLSGIDGRPLRGADDKPQQNQATTQASSQTPEQVAQSIWDGMNSYERNHAAVSTLNKRGVLAKNAASRNWEKLDQGDKDLLVASLSEQQGQRWTDPNQKATDSSLPVLQNRDRSSAASIEQVSAISAAPDYFRAGVSRDFGNGAPVLEESESLPEQQIGRSDVSVTAQGRQIPVKYAVVEAQQILPSNTASGASIPEYSTGQAGKLRAIAGNGRSAGLIEGWRKGTTESYLNSMLNDDLHGIDPDVIRGMNEPILVRLMQSSDVTENIGDESNIANQATLGAIEQAKTDARRIDLSSLEFDEDNITDKSLQGFIAGMPISDRSALMDGKLPSKQARARMEAAIFQQAYGNDELTRVQAQAITDESRNIVHALMQAAPAMSKLDGAGEFDIRALVSEAASVAVNARRSGAKLKDYIAQNDFGRNPEIQPLLEMMAANINSAKNMAEKLKNLAAIAYAESMKGGVDLFGEVKKPSTSQLMNLAFNGVQIDERKQNTDGSGQENLGQQRRAESNALDAEQPATHSGRTAGGKPIETAQPEPASTNQQEVKTEPWRRNYIAAAKRARQLGIDPKQYKELSALIAQIEMRNVPKLRSTEIQDDFSSDFNQDFDLTTQTEAELSEQAERIKQAENEAKAEQAEQDAEAKNKQEKANDKQQADATLDNFELGQSGEAQLSGMGDMFAIDQAANEAATSPTNDKPEPTQAQIEAGNYEKGHISIQGLDISIENPKGSQRKGIDPNGKPWAVTMQHHYGYIKRTEGADGDHVDAFIGNNPDSTKVFVVDQTNPDGSFDEHKVMIGFDDRAQAITGYKSSYSKDWKVGNVSELSMNEFKQWLKDGDTAKPLSNQQPKRNTILPGDVFITLSGRHTTPYPKYNPKATKGQAAKENKAALQWLKDNAIAEAQAKGDRFNLRQFEGLNVNNWSPVDGYQVGLYLFGDEHIEGKNLRRAEPNQNGNEKPTTKPEAPASASKTQESEKQQSLSAQNEEQAEEDNDQTDSAVNAIRDAIDAMPTGELNKVAKQWLPELGIKPTLSKERNKTAFLSVPDGLLVVADALNIKLSDAQRKSLETVEYKSGKNTAMNGFQMHPPHTVRSKQAKTIWEQGWLSGNKQRNAMLDGKETAKVGDRVAIPDVVSRGREWVVEWRSNGAGYRSYQEALEAMKQQADGDKEAAIIQPVKDALEKELRKAKANKDESRARLLRQKIFGAEDAVSAAVAQDSMKPFAEYEALFPDAAKALAEIVKQQSTPQPYQQEQRAERNAESSSKEPNSKPIKDFGEKIAGARKDYASKLKDAKELDIATNPFAKVWPEPNYQKLLDGGMNPEHAALIRAIRDEIPAKPRHAWKLKQWVKQVQTLRESVTIIMADPDSASEFAKRIEENNVVSGITGRATLYEALGHEESLKDYNLKAGSYGVFNGVRYSPNKTFWTVSKEGKGGRFETILSSGETKAEALADYLAKRKTAAPKAASAAKGATFDIYTDRYTKDVFIGKKIGTKIARIKTGFATVKEARLYKAEHQAELEERLAKFKDVPNERNETNAPRVGIDHRNGANVTPEQFGETFGFRGVQFGNSVEQKRRQQDLNDAYDGLMDLAGILNLPPKALSLNGELALAFGARGIGGKHPFKAHYEPGEVVINLTKGNGAGSLAHEWWHALDNYFAKDRNGGKAPDFYGTEHGYHSSTRQEMKEAFAAIASAVNRAGIKARSQKLDTTRTKAYWSTGREMTARAFESYIIEKLRDQNQSNDYLANIVSEDYWNAAAALGVEKGNTYPYPEAAELPGIRAAYESFFQTIEHKETDDGDVLLFSRTPATKAAYESRIDALFNGSKPNQQGVTVLDRSDVLDLLGFGDMPVVLNEKHAINDGRFNHPLTAEQWKRIPDYLENPVAVFERDDGNLTFVTSELVDGKPLIVGISPEVGMIGGRSVAKQHLLLTAYVRDRGDLPVKRMINDGELRYVDTRKSPEFNAGSGLQIPSSGIDLRGLGYKVHTGADLFKYRQDNQTNYRMDAPDVVTSGMTRTQAQAIADKVLGGKNDDVIIVQSFKDLPEDVKRAVSLDGTSDDGFNALHFKGKSYIVADAMNTPAKVEAAIFHEHYTHGGLRAKYGKDLGKKLDDMLAKAGGIVGLRMQAAKQGISLAEYEKALARNPGMSTQNKKRILMEELLAHMSATTGTLRRRLEEILGAIRQWLRDNGFAELAKLRASDIAYTLKQAREAAQAKDQANASGKGQAGSEQVAYSFSEGVELGITAEQAKQQFADTEKAYGGKAAYEKAKEAGRTNLNYHQWVQVRTPAFKAWFGDWENNPEKASKVVDPETGEPMVVYHGTGADFDSFSNEKKAGGQLGNGFYFAPTSSGANMFAKIRKMRDTNAAPSVIPAYVSIQNPYIIDGRGSIPINGINAELLADMGHDGVMVMKGGAIDEITAFNPEQIKSAIGNNGSFDGTNPDITYLRAFHGSPHLFNEFDLEKIGDGVGAQAYGYGLYFAGSEDVARFYKEQSYGEGNLYQVDIPEVDDLLNYDKPLSQQPEQVKAGVKAMLKRPEAVLFTATQKAVEGNATGEAIYRALAKDLGSQQEASAAFNKAGIPGLTYQGIEHRVVGGKGSRNYVIWDDSLVDMEAINGQRAQAQALFSRKTPPDGFAPKQGEADKYRGNLKRLMRSLRTNEPAIEVTSMPKVLQQMGVGNAPITISRDVVRKATNGVKHNVPMSAIERLPEELHDPLAVFESATEDGALVVLTELQDESGRPVIVALDLRKAGNEYGIARISSLYGKDNFAGWVSKNKLVYKSKRASGSHLLKQALVHESSVLKGLQLPNSVSDTRGSGKVLTEDDILSNDDPVMFSRTSAARDNLASKAEAVLNAADKWADRERVIPNGWTDAQKSAASKFDTFTPRQPFSSKLKQIRATGKDRFVQKVFDQFRPLKSLSKKAYMQAQLAKGHAGALEAVATMGTPYLRDGAIAVKQDENGFIGKLSKLGDMEEVRKFLMWVAANRAEKLMSDRRENLFSRDDIDAMKAFATGTLKDGRARAAAYAQAAQELRKYNKAVLDIAEQAGLVNSESRAEWESEFYIPFYRVLEDENGTPSRKHSHADARLVRQEVIKRLKGGTDNLGDPLENILANWGSLLGASMRNMAASEALKEGETLGISSKVGEQDFAAGERGNTWTMQNGQRVYWHVYDAPVMEALEAMNFTGYDNPFMKAAGAFKRALTTGVTISPVFRANNLVRDLVHSMAVADVSYNPLKNLADGWKMTGKGTDSMAQLLAGGGAIRFGSFTDGNAGDVVKRMIKSGIEDHQILNTPEKFKNALTKFFTSYQEFGDRAETVNRAAVYQRVLAETGSHLEASFAARDLMNFSSMGSAAVIRAMAQVLPFFNARLQGMDRLVRGAADNPMRFAKVVGVLGAASALLFLMQADDDEYKALPDYVRDTYWPVKLGGTWLYIPKPFEVGALATVIERGTELMTAGNDYQAKDFAATLTSTLINTLAMNPVPQIIRPAMESWFNYDMFRGRPIDSMGMERLLPQDRYDANTSAGAVALGQALNSSPQKIEHMVRGYFGWLGLQALNVTDILGRSLSDMPASSRRDLSQINNWFVVGNVAKESGTLPSKYVERFYDMQREINELYQSANAARKAGNTDRYNELMGDPKMKARNMLNSANNRITLINRQIKAITARADLSAKEKNEAIQRLNERRNAIAKQVDDMARA